MNAFRLRHRFVRAGLQAHRTRATGGRASAPEVFLSPGAPQLPVISTGAQRSGETPVSRPCPSLLLAALLVVCTPAPAQTADRPTPPPTAKTYRIAGRVLDSADGRPLRHAGITVVGNGEFNGHPPETVTDDTGRFAVTGVPAGKFRVEASARGYITASYDEHENYSSAVITGAGVDTESLLFHLQPIAMIHGRVTDEVGDPVRNAAITLYRENLDSGVLRVTQWRGAQTNDLGEYEFTRLPAGTYYASVRANPWYAVYPADVSGREGQSGVAGSVDPALNVAYPLTFYPEATDSKGASPIVVKPGDRFHANFRITPQPAMRLTVQMAQAGSRGAGLRSNPQLQQKVFDSMEPVFQQRMQMSDSALVLGGLPPGHYFLRVNGAGGQGSARSVDLVGGSVTVDNTSPTSFGSVTISLASPPGSAGDGTGAAAGTPAKLPVGLPLVLHRVGAEDDGNRVGATVQMKDGKAEFANVEPGDYRIEPRNNRYHVDTVSEGGQTRSGALLHVTGEGQTVTVTLGTGSVGLNGFARNVGKEGKGVSGVMMVLVPAGGDHSLDLYRRDQSDLDGSFHFNTVLPGNYLLVAIADGWTLEWGKPEALTPYLLKAVPVTVAPGSRGPMNLAEPVPVQSR